MSPDREPTGPLAEDDPYAIRVPDDVRAELIGAYPTISGMTAESVWRATPDERVGAWRRIAAARHLRAVLDVTYPEGWF